MLKPIIWNEVESGPVRSVAVALAVAMAIAIAPRFKSQEDVGN